VTADVASTRAEMVRRYVQFFRAQVRWVAGVAVIGPAVVSKVLSLITFLEETASRDQAISAELEALRIIFGYAGVTTDASKALGALVFEQDVDTKTAAELLNMEGPPLRKALRAGRIVGRKVNGKWRVAMSEIEEHRRKAA
jgi:hypothetical protein